MSFPVTVGLDPGDEKLTSTAKLRALGTRGVTPDGRVFYWSQNGATLIGGSKVVQTAVQHGASIQGQALDVVGAVTTGVTTLTVTLGATDIGANLYADGYVTIDTSPGTGMYQIDAHPAAASVANVVITLAESDPLREALTSGTTKVGLRQNPYQATIIQPTTVTGVAIGVTPVEVAASGAAVDGVHPDPVFFWLQTYGPCQVFVDAALVEGRNVIVPGASAGNVTTQTTTADAIPDQVIGTAITVGAGDEAYNHLFLTLRA